MAQGGQGLPEKGKPKGSFMTEKSFREFHRPGRGNTNSKKRVKKEGNLGKTGSLILTIWAAIPGVEGEEGQGNRTPMGNSETEKKGGEKVISVEKGGRPLVSQKNKPFCYSKEERRGFQKNSRKQKEKRFKCELLLGRELWVGGHLPRGGQPLWIERTKKRGEEKHKKNRRGLIPGIGG